LDASADENPPNHRHGIRINWPVSFPTPFFKFREARGPLVLRISSKCVLVMLRCNPCLLTMRGHLALTSCALCQSSFRQKGLDQICARSRRWSSKPAVPPAHLHVEAVNKSLGWVVFLKIPKWYRMVPNHPQIDFDINRPITCQKNFKSSPKLVP